MALFFILPAFLIYTLLFIYPAIQALWVSLHNWTGFTKDMVFIGLGNYVEMSRDPLFWGALGRTLIIAVVGGIGVFASPCFSPAPFSSTSRANASSAR
jgi:ABC-type sugar transport system permease subunit